MLYQVMRTNVHGPSQSMTNDQCAAPHIFESSPVEIPDVYSGARRKAKRSLAWQHGRNVRRRTSPCAVTSSPFGTPNPSRCVPRYNFLSFLGDGGRPGCTSRARADMCSGASTAHTHDFIRAAGRPGCVPGINNNPLQAKNSHCAAPHNAGILLSLFASDMCFGTSDSDGTASALVRQRYFTRTSDQHPRPAKLDPARHFCALIGPASDQNAYVPRYKSICAPNQVDVCAGSSGCVLRIMHICTSAPGTMKKHPSEQHLRRGFRSGIHLDTSVMQKTSTKRVGAFALGTRGEGNRT
jgi:hypothetical protein